MDLVLAAKFGDPGDVMTGHDEDQIGAANDVAGEESGPVFTQVQSLLETHQIGALGHRSAVPCSGTRRRNRDLIESLGCQGASKQALGHRAATGVSGTDEENVHDRRSAEAGRRTA